jgi:hypothetical protein
MKSGAPMTGSDMGCSFAGQAISLLYS